MYLVAKRVKNQYYYYIRESKRNKNTGVPYTKTIKCLGNAKKYSKKDIEFIKKLLKDKTENVFKFIDDLREDNKLEIIKRNNKINKEKKDKCIICGFDIVTEIHHKIPTSEGGSHDEENLVCLCPNHHQMVHKGLLTNEEIQAKLNKVRGR